MTWEFSFKLFLLINVIVWMVILILLLTISVLVKRLMLVSKVTNQIIGSYHPIKTVVKYHTIQTYRLINWLIHTIFEFHHISKTHNNIVVWDRDNAASQPRISFKSRDLVQGNLPVGFAGSATRTLFNFTISYSAMTNPPLLRVFLNSKNGNFDTSNGQLVFSMNVDLRKRYTSNPGVSMCLRFLKF